MRSFLIALSLLAATQIAGAANITVFTDQAAWSNALIAEQPAAVPVTETFDSGSLDVPGLSVATSSGMGPVLSSGLGQITDGAWQDQVGKNASLPYDTTQFSYASNLFGIGGDWNVSPSASGLELWVNTATGSYLPITIDSPDAMGAAGYSGWWGFVSDEPFTNVVLGSDTGATSFTLDNLMLGDPPSAVSATPEPNAAALLTIGLLGFAGTLAFRGRRA